MALSDFLADTPEVPHFKPVDTTTEQRRATTGNIANFGDISQLAGMANMFNQEQLNRMIEMGAPGYQEMLGTTRGRVNSLLSGELPADVMSNVERSAAHRALSGGYGGSGMARNLVARDLGLTSLDMITKGIDAGNRWMASARAGTTGQFDPTSMFVTPQQRIATTMQNRTNQWNRNWLDSQVDAATSDRTILANNLASLEGATGTAAGYFGGAALNAGGGGGGGGL